MKITKAETAGFCFGVNRAVNMVYDLLDSGKRVCTLGPIIHNPQLVAELESRGVRIVSSPEEVKEGETLVIRSHGVEKAVYDDACNLGVDVADATCPFVAKIHKIVAENSAKGAVTIIAGDRDHQEVKGIIGHCLGEYFVVASEEEREVILENERKIGENDLIFVSQTTFNAQIWEKLQKKLNFLLQKF